MVSIKRPAGTGPLLLALLCGFVLFACASPEPAPKDRFYAIDTQAARSLSARQQPLPATLLIHDLATRGFLGGRQILFRTASAPLEIQRYPQYLWEAPPGRALAAELAVALRQANLFKFVLGSEQRSRSDFVLSGELTRFEHRPTANQPQVAADFTLTLLRGQDRRVLLNARYQGTEPTEAATPEDMARAFIRLAARLIGQAIEDLHNLLHGLSTDRAGPRHP